MLILTFSDQSKKRFRFSSPERERSLRDLYLWCNHIGLDKIIRVTPVDGLPLIVHMGDIKDVELQSDSTNL